MRPWKPVASPRLWRHNVKHSQSQLWCGTFSPCCWLWDPGRIWVRGAPKSSGSALNPWTSPPLIQSSSPSLLTAFLRGQKLRLGQTSSSLKARYLGDWSYALCPFLNAAGYNEFSVYQSSSSTCVQPLEEKKDQGQRLQIWSGRSRARTKHWVGRCLLFPSPVLALRRPWLNPLPADPQEPKHCTLQDKTQRLLWKHLSFLIGSWADEPAFMWAYL